MNKKVVTGVVGSREEGEYLWANDNTKKQQTRYETEWNRIYEYCEKQSGIDGDGLLNKGNDGREHDLKLIRGGVYYYRNVVRDGKIATEFVYLVPCGWGVISFTDDRSDIWHDIK